MKIGPLSIRLLRTEHEPPARGLKTRPASIALPKRDALKSAKGRAERQNAYASTIAGSIIDKETNDVFSQGWTLQGDDEALISRVRDYLDAIDLEGELRKAVTEARIHGVGVLEIADYLGMKKPVAISGTTLEPVVDGRGWPDGFLQRAQDDGAGIALPAAKLIQIVLIPSTVDVGISEIARARPAVERYEQIQEDNHAMIERAGYPTLNLQIPESDGMPVSDDIGRVANAEMADIGPGSALVTAGNAQLVQLNASGVPHVQTYADMALQAVATAFMVPRSYVGLLDNSEATARITTRVHYARIASEQKAIARRIQHDLVDAYVLPACGGRPGDVKLAFNEPDPSSALDKANYVKALMSLDPADPYALYDKYELAEMLGKHPKDGEYDDGAGLPTVDSILAHLKDAGLSAIAGHGRRSEA